MNHDSSYFHNCGEGFTTYCGCTIPKLWDLGAGASTTTLRPGRVGFQSLDHVQSSSIHCHTPTRQMKHGSSYHHVLRKGFTTYCGCTMPKLWDFGASTTTLRPGRVGFQYLDHVSTKLLNPFQYIHKANWALQQLSSCLGGRLHNILWCCTMPKLWDFSASTTTLRPKDPDFGI